MARILIIDDDDMLLGFVGAILEDAGHTTSVARDGKVGLEQFRAEPADLVITDIFMPGKEGLETIRELRRDYPGVKIIAISGGGNYQKIDVLETAVKFGAVYALRKPFRRKELLAAIDDVLGGSPAQD